MWRLSRRQISQADWRPGPTGDGSEHKPGGRSGLGTVVHDGYDVRFAGPANVFELPVYSRRAPVQRNEGCGEGAMGGDGIPLISGTESRGNLNGVLIPNLIQEDGVAQGVLPETVICTDRQADGGSRSTVRNAICRIHDKTASDSNQTMMIWAVQNGLIDVTGRTAE